MTSSKDSRARHKTEIGRLRLTKGEERIYKTKNKTTKVAFKETICGKLYLKAVINISHGKHNLVSLSVLQFKGTYIKVVNIKQRNYLHTTKNCTFENINYLNIEPTWLLYVGFLRKTLDVLSEIQYFPPSYVEQRNIFGDEYICETKFRWIDKK